MKRRMSLLAVMLAGILALAGAAHGQAGAVPMAKLKLDGKALQALSKVTACTSSSKITIVLSSLNLDLDPLMLKRVAQAGRRFGFPATSTTQRKHEP